MKWDEILKRAKAEKSRTHNDDEEHRIQKSCVEWFRLAFADDGFNLFAIPNGGKREVRSYRKKNGTIATYCPEGVKLKEEGAVAGVADLFLAVPNVKYHGLFVEMKTRTGRQADTQIIFQHRVERKGYKYVICHSFDEFRAAIMEYYRDNNGSKERGES